MAVDRDEQLTALRSAVKSYVDREVKRLKAETTFLKSVLEGTAEGAVASSAQADELAALASVRKIKQLITG